MKLKQTPKTVVRGLGFSLAVFLASSCARAESLPPMPEGTHIVGTTRFVLAEEFGQAGDEAIERWMIGEAGDDAYIRGRLDPSVDFGIVKVRVPDDPSLYGPRSGDRFEVVYFVSYPTDPGNARADYVFPYSKADSVFERMQGAGEEPIFANPSAKHPLVLVSHGIRSHSIWDLSVTKTYAKNGYISAAIFYGDGRFPNEDTSFYNGALRPLISKQVLDDLLASSFGDHIDKDRIGMVGNSFGGMTTIALMGGRIANHPSSQRDRRIHAGVGVVPWVGSGSFYPFGSGNLSVGAVDKPFMTIYGTRDVIAPASFSLATLQRMGSSAFAVALNDAAHWLTPNENADSMNWQLLFFDAYLKDNDESLRLLKSVESFEGGTDDQQIFAYQRIGSGEDLPLAEAFDERAGPTLQRIEFEGTLRWAVVFARQIETGSLSYELFGSEDLQNWNYVESIEIASPSGFQENYPVKSGYRWAALVERNSQGVERSSFYQVRARRRL